MAASATESSELSHTWSLKGRYKVGGSKNEVYRVHIQFYVKLF